MGAAGTKGLVQPELQNSLNSRLFKGNEEKENKANGVLFAGEMGYLQT